MTTIKVSKACKSYLSGSDSNVVMNNFNMNVQQGTIYAMMGSSGCGKTTLISCLVGLKSLDSGDIEIFDEPPRVNKLRIGYMPQESALINEFTVREMVWFFGTIYGVKVEKINERLRFLSDLLELPDKDRLLRDCSGGEKRRVSFALTLVHEPELLILDEPTVGVDPLLRHKIWEYLIEITTTKNVTVLLSTHYIEEAKQSTHVGVMRNGIQIAEDTPDNILQMTETANLDEAFLKLSEKQERLESKASSNLLENLELRQMKAKPTSVNHSVKVTKHVAAQSFSGILFALVIKHYLKILRNIDLLVIALLLPVIGLASLHFGIGGQINGISLGIVNHEVDRQSECSNRSLVTARIVDYDCQLRKLSCRFINDLEDDIASKKYYKTIDEAFAAAKKTEIIGIIYFAPNFTESLTNVFDFKDAGDDRSDSGSIQVHLDNSNMQTAGLIKKRLQETYEKFAENLMVDCGKSRKAGNVPIVFEDDFGRIDLDLRNTFVPGFIVAAYFTIASYITCISIITSKVDGTWERTIVAGVEPNHYLLSHLIEGLVIVTLQFLEYICYFVFILASPSVTLKSAIIVALILLFIGIAGLLFGLLSSICFKSVMASTVIAQCVVYPVNFLSGIMWPVEALPVALKYCGYFFPLAFPTIAFRNLLVKNTDLSNRSVVMAFVTLTTWIVVELLLCVWLINREDNSNAKSEKKIVSKD